MTDQTTTLTLTSNELTDLRRAVVIAMQQLDATGNPPDVFLANRLEVIEAKLHEDLTIGNTQALK